MISVLFFVILSHFSACIMEHLDSIATDVLHQFKSKIKEAICLFNTMPDCMKLEAVHFWKYISTRIKFSPTDQPPSDEDVRVVELEPVEEVVSSQVDCQISDGQISDTDTSGLIAPAEKLRVVFPEKNSVDCNGSVLSNDEEDVTETMFCYSDIDIVTCGRINDKQEIKLPTTIYAKKDLSDDVNDCDDDEDDAKKDEQQKTDEAGVPALVKEETVLDISEMKEIAKTNFQVQTGNNSVLRKSKQIRIRKDKTDLYFDLELPEGGGPVRLVNSNATDLNETVCVDAFNIISNEAKASIHPQRKAKRKSRSRNSPESYTCEICGLELAYMDALIVHRSQHSGDKPYTCSICGRGFAAKGNKVRHEKTHSGEKPYECHECQKRFTAKKSLKVHMRSHTGERPYKCKICGRGFAQTGILQTHIYLHTGHKGHICDTCGKAFRQKSQLRLHQKRHLNQRSIQCPEPDCEATFFTNSDLRRHKLKHSGARPFSCNLCPKTFTRLQYLKEHLNQHSGVKPYTCKLCEISFYDMSNYYRHVRRHKPESEDNAASAAMAETTETTPTVIEEVEMTVNDDPNGSVMTYIVTPADVTEEEQKAFEQQAVVAAAAAAETHLATIPTGQEDDTTAEVYQITVDPSLITRDEQVVTTVDFSAINLLANATTQEYLSTTS